MEIKTLDDLREAVGVHELQPTTTLQTLCRLLADDGRCLVYEGLAISSPASLRKARRRHGFSLREASERTGLHRPNIVVAEQRGTVRLSTLLRILGGYGGRLTIE